MGHRVFDVALLDLVVGRQRSYDAIAAFVGLTAGQVKRMARVAVIELAADDAESPLDFEQRERIAACLLGQQAPAERSATLSDIRSSHAVRAWAVAALAVLCPFVEVTGDEQLRAAAPIRGLGSAQDFGAGAQILRERIGAAGDRTADSGWERLIAPSRRSRRGPLDRWLHARLAGRAS